MITTATQTQAPVVKAEKVNKSYPLWIGGELARPVLGLGGRPISAGRRANVCSQQLTDSHGRILRCCRVVGCSLHS